MNWVPSIPSIVAIVVALLAFIGATYTRRKERADAASIITATAMSLLAPLNIKVAELSGSVAVLQTQVTALNLDNRHLRIENATLRDRVGTLERQITGLGHTPVNGHPSMVTTSTTEVVTVTEGATS